MFYTIKCKKWCKIWDSYSFYFSRLCVWSRSSWSHVKRWAAKNSEGPWEVCGQAQILWGKPFPSLPKHIWENREIFSHFLTVLCLFCHFTLLGKNVKYHDYYVIVVSRQQCKGSIFNAQTEFSVFSAGWKSKKRGSC